MTQETLRRLRSSGRTVAVAIVSLFLLVVVACSDGEEAAGRGDSWQLEGQLLAWDGSIWIIDAVPVDVPASLGVDEQRVLGAQVTAMGHYDDMGRRIADSVSVADGQVPESTLESASLTGTLVRADGNMWIVDETTVLLDDGTRVVMEDGSDARSLPSAGSTLTVEGYRFRGNTIIAAVVTMMRTSKPAGNEMHEPIGVPAGADETQKQRDRDRKDDAGDAPDPSESEKDKQKKNEDDDDDDDDDEGFVSPEKQDNRGPGGDKDTSGRNAGDGGQNGKDAGSGKDKKKSAIPSPSDLDATV